MSLLASLAWHLKSDERELELLRSRGLTIGGGVRDSQWL